MVAEETEFHIHPWLRRSNLAVERTYCVPPPFITSSSPVPRIGFSAYGTRGIARVVSRALTAAGNSAYSLQHGCCYRTSLEQQLSVHDYDSQN